MRDACTTCPLFLHGEGQGAGCECSREATLMALGLHRVNYISRDGGTRITDNGPEPLFLDDQCSTCNGQCPVPEACGIPVAKPPKVSAWARFLSYFK